MYCIKYKNIIKPYFGFISPWNSVRDDETYSQTYLTPSMLNGIEEELQLPMGSIIRHKLIFDSASIGIMEQIKTPKYYKGGVNTSIHKRHYLINPEIILAFNTKEEAEYALQYTIYLGQLEFTIAPDVEFGVKVYSEEEFDNLSGVETFSTNEEEGFFCGVNRFKDYTPMYINLTRIEWDLE